MSATRFSVEARGAAVGEYLPAEWAAPEPDRPGWRASGCLGHRTRTASAAQRSQGLPQPLEQR